MQAQTKGILLMALGAASIPIVDGMAKGLTEVYSPLYVSFMRYAFSSIAVIPVAAIFSGKAMLPPRHRLVPHVMRTAFMVAAMTCYYVAITHIALATAVATFFIGPILAAALAVVFLRERLTWPKVAALVLGFGGALFIARPGTTLEPGILLALASGVFFAFYLVATRMASGETTPLQALFFQYVFGSVLLLPFAISTWQMPHAEHIATFAVMGVLSLVSHGLSIAAFRYADASTLAPLTYAELATAAAIGYFFFGEVPPASVWIGAGIIIAAGLLLVLAGQRRKI